MSPSFVGRGLFLDSVVAGLDELKAVLERERAKMRLMHKSRAHTPTELLAQRKRCWDAEAAVEAAEQ